MNTIEAITVPKWGLTMSEGTVSEWLVEEGAEIRIGDAIMDMETSKIVNTVEAIIEGKLRRIVAQPGDTLDIGALLGVVAADEVEDADIDDFIDNFVIDGVASTDALGSKVGVAEAPVATTEPAAVSAAPESQQALAAPPASETSAAVSYTHLRAHET